MKRNDIHIMEEIFKDLDNNLITYEDNDIEIIIDNKERIWFKVKDVLLMLGYKDYRYVVKNQLERKYVKVKKDIDGEKDNYQSRSLFVSEPGFYKLITRSKLPAAVKFTDWVYEELLPAGLRKDQQ